MAMPLDDSILRPTNLPDRRAYHWPRRIFHMISGVLVAVMSLVIQPRELFMGVLLSFVVLEFTVELLRLRFEFVGKVINRTFRFLMREGETRRMSGVPYYGFGCFISFMFFPKPVAVLAVLYLAIGDPIASLIGVYSRRRRSEIPVLPAKSFAGSLGCFTATTFIGLALCPYLFPPTSFSTCLFVSMMGGLGAMIAELLPMRTDDNLSLPLISGAFLWLVTSFLGLVPGLIG